MKIGDRVEAVGYQHLKKDNKIIGLLWPDFLLEGIHRINKVKASKWGTLVKTDRHPKWINANWFIQQ